MGGKKCPCEGIIMCINFTLANLMLVQKRGCQGEGRLIEGNQWIAIPGTVFGVDNCRARLLKERINEKRGGENRRKNFTRCEINLWNSMPLGVVIASLLDGPDPAELFWCSYEWTIIKGWPNHDANPSNGLVAPMRGPICFHPLASTTTTSKGRAEGKEVLSPHTGE